MSFPPAATGGRTATVTITDDAPGSPQSVSLTGTGVTPPTATLSATSSVFGNQRVGTTSATQNRSQTHTSEIPPRPNIVSLPLLQTTNSPVADANTVQTVTRA